MRKLSNKPARIGALLLTGLLSVGACAPVCAQVANPAAPPPAAAPAPAPAGAPVPWNSLSQDQQHLLSRVAGQWDQLPAQRQQALASGSQRWQSATPPQRKNMVQRARQRRMEPPPPPKPRRFPGH